MNKDSESNINLIELVEDTFNKVNYKIDGLLNCSIKDFDLLNSGFKKHHNLLNSLSDSTNSFFEFIALSDHDNNIIEQCKLAENNALELKKTIKKQLSYLKNLNSKYNFIILNTSNLKQDISTLKLLFTNLRFDPSLNIDQKKFFYCINKLSDCYKKTEKNIKVLFNKLNSITNYSEEGYSNGLELYSDLIAKINNQIILFSSIRQAALKYKEQTKEIEEKKASNTSEIITNLQFQDILRQKIEHIQSAHEEITTNLYATHKSGNGLSQKELYQIRDISSLQSALLVHANQEYRSSVENILKRISDMRQLIGNYSSIWNQFCLPEKAKIENTILKVKEDLSQLKSHSVSLNQISEKYVDLLSEISTLQMEISDNTDADKGLCNGISVIELLLENTSISKTDIQQFNPIQQLKTELIKFRKGYNKLTNQLSEFKNNSFSDYISSFQKNELNTQKLKANSDKIANLIDDLSAQIEKDISSDKIPEKISKFAVDQIEYYKTFEKEVQEMIRMLNNLLGEVDLSKTNIDEKDLDHLKELYTMQSERDIHENLTKKKNSDSENLNQKNNNNEVEFF